MSRLSVAKVFPQPRSYPGGHGPLGLRLDPEREALHSRTQGLPDEDLADEMRDAIVCRRCGHVITSRSERIVMDGAHAHTFANPEGLVFEIGCYRTAWGCGVVGPASREFAWFAGTVWRIAVCTNCLAHLGWRFSALNGAAFHGLILTRLGFNH